MITKRDRVRTEIYETYQVPSALFAILFVGLSPVILIWLVWRNIGQALKRK